MVENGAGCLPQHLPAMNLRAFSSLCSPESMVSGLRGHCWRPEACFRLTGVFLIPGRTFLPLVVPPLFLFFSLAGIWTHHGLFNHWSKWNRRSISIVISRFSWLGTFLAGGIFILGPSSLCPTSSHQPTWQVGSSWKNSTKLLVQFQ